MTCWREEATHWPSEVSVQRAAADGQATRWIWMRAVKRVMRQGRPPPPFKPMQAWTMRAVFHWKHWEPALAFSQTIEALASCRHGSDAAVKSLFLHPLMNKTSWTSRLAAFLNTTVAPMPRLMLRSPLEIVPRHWWRSDRGLVQQQISEWVSLKLFCLTCWICPSC